jgi:hypothetical protein
MTGFWRTFRDQQILDKCKECGAPANIIELSNLFVACSECANSTDTQPSIVDAMVTWNKAQRKK